MKIHAKDLVRIRKAIEKFEMAKANLQGIQIQLMTASGQEAIMKSMKDACKSYRILNGMMDPSAIQKIMSEYTKETTKQEMMAEIMDDVMDDALGNDAQAEDDLVQQVLQEIGVDITSNMASAPSDNVAMVVGKDDDLENRIDGL